MVNSIPFKLSFLVLVTALFARGCVVLAPLEGLLILEPCRNTFKIYAYRKITWLYLWPQFYFNWNLIYKNCRSLKDTTDRSVPYCKLSWTFCLLPPNFSCCERQGAETFPFYGIPGVHPCTSVVAPYTAADDDESPVGSSCCLVPKVWWLNAPITGQPLSRNYIQNRILIHYWTNWKELNLFYVDHWVSLFLWEWKRQRKVFTWISEN